MKNDSIDISVRIMSFLFLLGIILIFLNLKLLFFSFNHIQELIKKNQIVIPLTIVGIPSLSILIAIMISGSNEADISKVIINSIEFIIGLFSRFIPKLNVVKIIKEETLLKLIKNFIRILRKKNIILIIGLTDIFLFSCFIYFQISETYITLNDKNKTLDYNKNDHKKNIIDISGYVIGKFLFPPDSVSIYGPDYLPYEFKYWKNSKIDNKGKFCLMRNYTQFKISYNIFKYFAAIKNKNTIESVSDTCSIEIILPVGPLLIWKVDPYYSNRFFNCIRNNCYIEFLSENESLILHFNEDSIIKYRLEPSFYNSTIKWSIKCGEYNSLVHETSIFNNDTTTINLPAEEFEAKEIERICN